MNEMLKFNVKSLISVVRPARMLSNRSYSSLNDQISKMGQNVDPVELLSDEEIEFEVRKQAHKNSKVQQGN